MEKNILIFFIWFLCSCNNGTGGAEEPLEAKPLFGWRSAGLTPDPSEINNWGTGLAKIVHSGDYIFIMDAAIGKDENSPRYMKAMHNIFISKQGIETWDTLKLPQSLEPLSFYADSSGLYVGSYVNAEVWHYEPASKKWTNMNILELTGNQGFNVYGIARLNGQFVISLAGFDDTTAADKLIIAPILFQQFDGTWKDISPPNPGSLDIPSYLRDTPLQFFTAREWRGDLFIAMSKEGVWRYTGLGGQWSKIPNPNKPHWNFEYNGYYSEEYIPQALTIHKDRLYMAGRAGGIYMLNDDLENWTGIDSIRTEGSSLKSNTPLEPYSLASDGENLFVSGTIWGIPAVYMGDRGEPKGWRQVDKEEWCNPSRFSCLGLSTYALDVIGDTLYAAAWEGLYKFPLADLDSAIVNESSYK